MRVEQSTPTLVVDRGCGFASLTRVVSRIVAALLDALPVVLFPSIRLLSFLCLALFARASCVILVARCILTIAVIVLLFLPCWVLFLVFVAQFATLSHLPRRA